MEGGAALRAELRAGRRLSSAARARRPNGDAALGASGFRIAVRHEIADDALTVLAGDGRAPSPSADGLDVGSGPRRFGDRPAWIRWATIAVLAAMAGPPLIAALFQLEWLIDGLFP